MVALNEQFTLKNPSLGSENRVGDFFCEVGQGVGENRLASRIGTKGKTTCSYETASGRPVWPSRDPIEEMNLREGSAFEKKLNGVRNELSALGIRTTTINRILKLLAASDLPEFEMKSSPFSDASLDDFSNPYRFCENKSLNSYDLLGLLTKEETLDAAKAVWEAAKYAVPGSEAAAALEVFGGCNSLGLFNAWLDRQIVKSMIACDSKKTKKLEADKKWATGIWNNQCGGK